MEKNRYRMTFDYHTHTTFSHGKGSIADNVKAAAAAGLSGIAITDHGPGHLTYGVRRRDFSVMREEVTALRRQYPEMEILLGVEANIVETGNHLDVDAEDQKLFDLMLGGYHYGILHGHCVGNWMDAHRLMPKAYGKKLLVWNTEMTVRALYENDLRILTHPGDKGRFDLWEIARACGETDTWMEISTWHDHLTVEELRLCAKADVRFVISSDAHTPDRVGSFAQGLERALAAGVEAERIVNVEECAL